jgi:hypothetical protein
MFELKQSRQTFLRNLVLRHIASTISSVWYGSADDSIWEGNLSQGYCIWRGDEGNEFICLWTPTTLLAVASILECSRAPEDDDGWDEEDSSSGAERGLQYLNNPSSNVLKLYKTALQKLDNEFITAGFWTEGDDIEFCDSSEESLECGLQYFIEFQATNDQFLWFKSKESWPSLASQFALTDELHAAAELSVKLCNAAFSDRLNIEPQDVALMEIKLQKDFGEVIPLRDWRSLLNKRLKDFGFRF